jgi:hypothetical protein
MSGRAMASRRLREAFADQGDRKLSLGGSMEGSDGRGQFLLFHVSEVIDEDGQGGMRRLGCIAGRLQKCLEDLFELAVVSRSGPRVEVHADLDFLVLHVGRVRGTRQAAHCPRCQVLRPLLARKRQLGSAQLGCQLRRE